MENKIYTCLIIGSGPCGIGAAISLKQSGFEDFAIIEKSTPGGKVNIAPRVYNYPGFKKIPGPDLAYELYKRTLDNKVNFIFDDVLSLTKEDDLFKIEGNDDNSIYVGLISFTTICVGYSVYRFVRKKKREKMY